MEIDLNAEDRELIERLVQQGRFASAEDVISVSLSLMQEEAEWKQYAQQRVDAGVEALTTNDFASEQEVDALFSKYRQHTA